MTGKRSLGWIAGVLLVLAWSDVALAQYHAGVGRFLQRDPIGYVDGMNLYEFVEGEPVVGVDPYGLEDGETAADDTKGLSEKDIKRAERLLKDANDADGVAEAVRDLVRDEGVEDTQLLFKYLNSSDVPAKYENMSEKAIDAYAEQVLKLTVDQRDKFGAVTYKLAGVLTKGLGDIVSGWAEALVAFSKSDKCMTFYQAVLKMKIACGRVIFKCCV